MNDYYNFPCKFCSDFDNFWSLQNSLNTSEQFLEHASLVYLSKKKEICKNNESVRGLSLIYVGEIPWL